jgi:hypothetical protein
VTGLFFMFIVTESGILRDSVNFELKSSSSSFIGKSPNNKRNAVSS